MLSGVNALTNSPKILHITKRDVFRLDLFHSDQKYDKDADVETSIVFGTVYHVSC